jgi:hypothetical protein
MRLRLVRFGEIEVEGELLAHDVVIDGGRVERRRKGPSKARRSEFGHTPLTPAEQIPWGPRGSRLVIGTGASGLLPVTEELRAEADRRGIDLVVAPTEEACRILRDVPRAAVRAILHATC